MKLTKERHGSVATHRNVFDPVLDCTMWIGSLDTVARSADADADADEPYQRPENLKRAIVRDWKHSFRGCSDLWNGNDL